MLRLYPHGHVSAKAVGNVYSVHITLPSSGKSSWTVDLFFRQRPRLRAV